VLLFTKLSRIKVAAKFPALCATVLHHGRVFFFGDVWTSGKMHNR